MSNLSVSLADFPRRDFYFVRHGRTEANEKKLWCGGGWDIELSAEGVRQAQTLANVMLKLSPPISQIFCSPMVRARTTAEHLNSQSQKDLKFVEDLREWHVGDWERTPWSNPLTPVAGWQQPPGGECPQKFAARVMAAVATHLRAVSGTPLFVAHGAVAHVLFSFLSIPEMRAENCVIYQFKAGAQWTVEVSS